MKELIQILVLVFILIGALYTVKVSMEGEMKARALLSTDYELFSASRKYDGIMAGLDFSVRKSFMKAYESCRKQCSSPSRTYVKPYLESYMENSLDRINNSISLALSKIQPMEYTRYSYYISSRKPEIRLGDPIYVGVKIHMDITTPRVEIIGDRMLWVDTGLNFSDLSSDIHERIKIKGMGVS